MKKSILIFIFSCLIINILQAQKPFDEATFNEMTAQWVKDPISFYKNECDTKFMFTNGNGKSYNQEEAVAMYTSVIATATKKVENLKVWQLGNTGIATGKTTESYVFKNGTTSVYTGIFTYTFSQQNGKWIMAAAQHTDYKAPIAEDEEAIKSVLNAETAAFDKADYKTYLGYYSKAKYTSFLYSAGLFVGDDLWKKMDEVHATRKAQKVIRTRSNWNIRVNGASAFVTYSQVNENTETNTKSEAYEERFLEKTNGEWKIVNTTVFTKK